MKKFNFKKLLRPVQVVVLAIALSALVSYVYATSFAEPGCAPTGCNAEAPLNVSGSAQIKTGGLTLNTGNAATGLIVYSGKVGIGTINPTQTLEVNGNVKATAYFYSSDRNLKKNIVPLSDSLNKVLQLQGVSYNLKSDNSAGVGLIAQDVQKVYPELVTGSEGNLTVDYARMVSPLIEAIKAQQKEIDQLKAEVQKLQGKK